MADVKIVNNVSEEQYEKKVAELLEKGYQLSTSDIGTNEIGEPFYRAILYTKGGDE